jgi:hypothetical protein
LSGVTLTSTPALKRPAVTRLWSISLWTIVALL